jgi:hypothetical protein
MPGLFEGVEEKRFRERESTSDPIEMFAGGSATPLGVAGESGGTPKRLLA